ncbi:sodium-dependent glucose transporter 1A [Caerostris extrusa]|uniref:Sodium-dependent glucose transporter 1A n=1 Tax=Caerostris extrusa TaxID=172846 RepID=A0AAV4MN62_CAEEX|nr:sodium-dependent glucose transporter 1A [Caerostris extrusa]
MPKLSTRSIKIIKTCNLYLCFLVLGMSVALCPANTVRFKNLVNTDMAHIAFIYTARSTGYLIGSLAGRQVYNLS